MAVYSQNASGGPLPPKSAQCICTGTRLLWLLLCAEVGIVWSDGEPEEEGRGMMVSKALGWLCEEPQHSFTLNKFFRRGWPGLANFFLLPKQLELGRAARTLERCLFWGGLAAFAVVGGRPALSCGRIESDRAHCRVRDARHSQSGGIPDRRRGKGSPHQRSGEAHRFGALCRTKNRVTMLKKSLRT
jgi:hypothetical protein